MVVDRLEGAVRRRWERDADGISVPYLATVLPDGSACADPERVRYDPGGGRLSRRHG
jgi:hypothetical protein